MNKKTIVIGRAGSGRNILWKYLTPYFKNSEEYATHIAPKVLGNRLEKVVKGADNTYFILKEDVCGEDCMNAEALIDYAILCCHIDISELPKNIRIEHRNYFIMAMRVSRYDLKKRLRYLEMYSEDITQVDECSSKYRKDEWYDIFNSYTMETLGQCIAGRSDITKELRDEFIDFLFNLPQEIRNRFYPTDTDR